MTMIARERGSTVETITQSMLLRSVFTGLLESPAACVLCMLALPKGHAPHTFTCTIALGPPNPICCAHTSATRRSPWQCPS
jgi:hypothetical protein